MDPLLCANGCGFFGSAATKNLCSKCYEDFVKENVTKSAEGLKDETKNLKGETFVPWSSSTSHKPCASKSPAAAAAAAAVSVTSSESVKNKKRCKCCNKKVGLTGFECRCGDVFCGRHRYPEEHACNVDLKEIGCQALAKQNPICIADKLEYRV